MFKNVENEYSSERKFLAYQINPYRVYPDTYYIYFGFVYRFHVVESLARLMGTVLNPLVSVNSHYRQITITMSLL